MSEFLGYKLTKTGLEGFSWPLVRDDLKKAVRDLVLKSVIFISNNESEDNFHNKNISIVNSYFIRKVLSIYSAKICLEVGSSPITNPLSQEVLKELNLIISASGDSYLKLLYLGFRSKVKRGNLIQEFIRNNAATFIRRDGFRRRNINQVDLENEIICPGVNNLMVKYLKKLEKKGVQVKISEFFPLEKPIESGHLNLIREDYKKNTFYNSYKEFILNWLKDKNVTLSKKEVSSLFNWLDNFLSFICIYRKSCQNSSYPLPKTLWTSSAGIMWNRILAIHVRKNGGKVITFDHAGGAAIDYESFTPFIEFQDTDIFVTFTSPIKENYIEASKGQVYKGKLPKIEFI